MLLALVAILILFAQVEAAGWKIDDTTSVYLSCLGSFEDLYNKTL